MMFSKGDSRSLGYFRVLRIAKTLYSFVLTQFRPQNRDALLLEWLYL